MTTHTPKAGSTAAWRTTRLGRAAAAVALSTLAVVTLASGAFAQLVDTIDLIGFSVESNDSAATPPPPTEFVDLAIGEGSCANADLTDSALNWISFAPSANTLDVAGAADGTNPWASAVAGEICIKSEGTTLTLVTPHLMALSSMEATTCTPGSAEETAEIALTGFSDCDAAMGHIGELDRIATLVVACDNGEMVAWEPSGASNQASLGVLTPGEMMQCTVEVKTDAMIYTQEDLQSALSDTLYFDLAITGEQPI